MKPEWQNMEKFSMGKDEMSEVLETWGCSICGAKDTQTSKKWASDLAEDIAAGFTGLICGNITCSGFWKKIDESTHGEI